MNNDFNAVQTMLMNTISMLCKNSLIVNRSLKIEGVIGITVDDSVFIVHINERESKVPESDQEIENDASKSAEQVITPVSKKRRENHNSPSKIKVKYEPIDENWVISPTNIDEKSIITDGNLLMEQNNYDWKPASRPRGGRRPRSTAKRKSLEPAADLVNWSEGVWAEGQEIGEGAAAEWGQEASRIEWDPDGSQSNQPSQDQYGGRMDANVSDDNKRPYICQYPDCGLSYKRSDHLARHQRAFHGKLWGQLYEVSFHCPAPNCTRTFLKEYTLQKHLNDFHNEEYTQA